MTETHPSSKTVTLAERIRQSIAAVKRSEMTARPGGSFMVFSLDMAAEAADAIEAMASVGIRQEREIERLLAINMALINANKSLADMAVEMQSSSVETSEDQDPCVSHVAMKGYERVLGEIRDHSTDKWAAGLAREAIGPAVEPT
jgi:hypothetical protein